MRIKRFIMLALALGAMVSGQAQRAVDVTLQNATDNEAVVVSAASADKGADAYNMAVENAIYAILTTGVDGLQNGQPMMVGDNKSFVYSYFKDKKYVDAINGMQRLSEDKLAGKRRVKAEVTVNLKTLMSQLKGSKVDINPVWKKDGPGQDPVGVHPSIVVVPYVKGNGPSDFSVMKDLVDNNPALRHAVGLVASSFAANGYKTKDFVTMLGGSEIEDIMRDGTQTDKATAVIQELPGDIVVSVDVSLLTGGDRRNSCMVDVNAVEKQTKTILARHNYASPEYTTSDMVSLVDYAVKNKIDKPFFNEMERAFKDMIVKGRNVVVAFTLGQNVTDWDFDTETPQSDEMFKEVLEDWLEKISVDNSYDLSRNTDKFIEANLNMPIWDKEKNRGYTVTRFTSDLRKFIKKHLGDDYKANVKSMGQRLEITIE